MKRCNLCGVPEELWEGSMICTQCRGTCPVIADHIVEERLYRYAERNGFLLSERRLHIPYLIDCVEVYEPYRRIPAYVKGFVKSWNRKNVW